MTAFFGLLTRDCLSSRKCPIIPRESGGETLVLPDGPTWGDVGGIRVSARRSGFAVVVSACLAAVVLAAFTPSTGWAQTATTTPRTIQERSERLVPPSEMGVIEVLRNDGSKWSVDVDREDGAPRVFLGLPKGVVVLDPEAGDTSIGISRESFAADAVSSDGTITSEFGVDIGVGERDREQANIEVRGIPQEGITICLPVNDNLRKEADGRRLLLIQSSDGTTWNRVESEYDPSVKVVCAPGVKKFMRYAVGYQKHIAQRRDLKMVLAAVGRTIASDAVEVLSGRFRAPSSQPHVTVGGQMLRLTGGKEGEAWKHVTDAAVGVARMFGVDGGANGRTLGVAGDAAALSRHPGLFNGGIDRTNWRAPVRTRDVSVKDVLARSAFELPLSSTDDGGIAGLTLWGRGMASHFSGSPATGFSMDGDLYSGYLGLDYRLDPKIMLGLALSHATGDVDYEVTRNQTKVGLDVQLTSVLPYARWQPYAGLGLWGMFGAGWGEMDLDVADFDGFNEKQTTDLTLVMGALGGRQALVSWQGIDFAAKADAFRSTLRSQGKVNLPSARGGSGRVRLLLEGRTDVMISPVSRLQPRLELGGRWDTGEADRGLGAEIGGGVAYTHTKLGLGVEAQGRYLLAHEEDAFEDWGASLKVRMDPGIKGQGFWLSMAPVWGRPSTGAERLWGGAGSAAVVLDSSRDRSGRSGWAPGQLEMDLGYGVAMSDGGLVTPYGGLALGRAGAARYRFGSRLTLNTVLDLRVEGEREEQSGGVVSHGVMTRLNWQW